MFQLIGILFNNYQALIFSRPFCFWVNFINFIHANHYWENSDGLTGQKYSLFLIIHEKWIKLFTDLFYMSRI